MEHLIISVFLTLIIADSYAVCQTIDTFVKYRSSLNTYFGPPDEDVTDLKQIANKAKGWRASLGPNVAIAPEIMEAHEALIKVDQLATSELCGSKGNEAMSALSDMIATATDHFQPDRVVLRALYKATFLRSRICEKSNLIEFERQESKVPAECRSNIESIGQSLSKEFQFDQTLYGKLARYEPNRVLLLSLLRELLISKDTTDGDEGLTEEMVSKLFENKIGQPCEVYLNTCRDIMKAVELDGQTDKNRHSSNSFSKYTTRFRACQVISDSSFREHVLKQLSKETRTS